jgi:hypothetical protein
MGGGYLEIGGSSSPVEAADPLPAVGVGGVGGYQVLTVSSTQSIEALAICSA